MIKWSLSSCVKVRKPTSLHVLRRDHVWHGVAHVVSKVLCHGGPSVCKVQAVYGGRRVNVLRPETRHMKSPFDGGSLVIRECVSHDRKMTLLAVRRNQKRQPFQKEIIRSLSNKTDVMNNIARQHRTLRSRLPTSEIRLIQKLCPQSNVTCLAEWCIAMCHQYRPDILPVTYTTTDSRTNETASCNYLSWWWLSTILIFFSWTKVLQSRKSVSLLITVVYVSQCPKGQFFRGDYSN